MEKRKDFERGGGRAAENELETYKRKEMCGCDKRDEKRHTNWVPLGLTTNNPSTPHLFNPFPYLLESESMTWHQCTFSALNSQTPNPILAVSFNGL